MSSQQRRHRWLAAALVATGVAVPACARAQGELPAADEAAVVEPVEGTDLASVTLTGEAARRLGIVTAPVRTGAGTGTIIPFAAVLYDASGHTWAYTQTGELTYVRAAITVDRVDGDLAYLGRGPAVGTPVVTVGVAELFGAEYGVGGE